MSVSVRWLAAGLALAFWPAAAVAQSMPACQLASDRDGQTVTVAVLGSPGILLSVDWGDGAFDATTRPLAPGRGRAFLRHEYASPGTYTVKASAATPDGRGCGVELQAQLPAASDVGAAAAAVLPPRGGPATSDQVEDRDLGEAMAEARVVPTPSRPSPLDFVRRLLSGLLGG